MLGILLSLSGLNSIIAFRDWCSMHLFYHNSGSVEIEQFPAGFPTSWIYEMISKRLPPEAVCCKINHEGNNTVGETYDHRREDEAGDPNRGTDQLIASGKLGRERLMFCLRRSDAFFSPIDDKVQIEKGR